MNEMPIYSRYSKDIQTSSINTKGNALPKININRSHLTPEKDSNKFLNLPKNIPSITINKESSIEQSNLRVK